MIELKLIRKTPKNITQKFTHGELFIKDNSGKWLDFCYTLEDKTRDINKNGKFDGEEKKVYGETSIPFGEYDGIINYSNHFKRIMPLILNVPEFKGIRIHGGNDKEDTFGCILVAHNTDWNGHIWGSAEHELTKIIKNNGSEFKIKII